MQDPNAEQGTLQLIVDQLEELVVTIFEELRERPAVVAAILAAVAGTVIGGSLASRGRKSSPQTQVRHKARTVNRAGRVAHVGFRLLKNPLVRGWVFAIVQRQLRNRMAH